jgi:hypothetical protein
MRISKIKKSEKLAEITSARKTGVKAKCLLPPSVKPINKSCWMIGWVSPAMKKNLFYLTP